MSRSFYKLASLLLQYPDEDLKAATAEIAASANKLLSPLRQPLVEFIDHWRTQPLTKLQQDYVDTFDFNRRACLYLSFHAYGDRRQRGVAMVQLKRRYASTGLPLREGELPDHLPVLLEFAALAPGTAGDRMLGEFRPSLELVRAALHGAGSPYALLLDAVIATLPNMNATERAAVRRLAAEGAPTESVGLEPFGPPEVVAPAGAAACGTAP